MALPDNNKDVPLTPEALMYASLGMGSDHDLAVAQALEHLLDERKLIIRLTQSSLDLMDTLVKHTNASVSAETLQGIASLRAGIEKLLLDENAH